MDRRLIAFLLLGFVAACSTLPVRPPDTLQSYHLPSQDLHSFGITSSIDPTESGVLLLANPRKALSSRLALADAAKHSLDVQYYIWDEDAAGAAIIGSLLRAADRGVRVRMLVDDLTLVGSDQRVLSLHNHPKIDVRAFNPFRFRKRYGPIRRTLDIVTSLSRINHRMHNKVFAADNTLAIMGGRNLADAYFGVDDNYGYYDIDVLVAGPVVADISKSFDAYWNSDWAVPIDALSKPDRSMLTTKELSRSLDSLSKGLLSKLGSQSAEAIIAADAEKMIWCKVELIADPPVKMAGDKNFVSPFVTRLAELMAQTRRELLVENAYFIPGKDGVERILELTSRDVAVSILTNSLVSNDSGASHAGYKKYRKGVVSAGAKLFELRPDAKLRETFELADTEVNAVVLHSKAAVFDGEIGFVGSFNIDARSRNINSETGVIVHDAGFATELAEMLRADMNPENSWRVALDARGKLEWRSAHEVRREPVASFGKRLTAWLLGLLPVEQLL